MPHIWDLWLLETNTNTHSLSQRVMSPPENNYIAEGSRQAGGIGWHPNHSETRTEQQAADYYRLSNMQKAAVVREVIKGYGIGNQVEALAAWDESGRRQRRRWWGYTWEAGVASDRREGGAGGKGGGRWRREGGAGG
ncbi:hypothetical protein B0H14DRAFT_2581883 [Mycena olivaceomarginata]|nr:hypothetical protein B0H14DRAFT_2581883 [Mycena olivaceomarginata]